MFFGGGTPSLADPESIGSFISFAKKNLKFQPVTEISLECNPENLDTVYLKEIKDAGITRLNVGVQSFDKKHLLILGRYFDKERYEKILQNLKCSGIDSIGCDLIYGIPGQTKSSFYKDVDRLIYGGVNHLSLYSLTAEKGTIYSRKIHSKEIGSPDERLQSEILLELPDLLKSSGFLHYEVSNYAKDGYFSRHNLKYWTMEYYLGLGPGAHGFTPKGRYANSKNIEGYLDNRFSLKYESPSAREELLLTIFRIFLPINLNSFLDLVGEKREVIENKVLSWSEKGFCDYRNGIFQWKKNSILNLDQFIFELAEL